jgi:hypothetical protein
LLPRERVYSALNYKNPDIIPLEYHPSPRGFYEHGEKLRQLFRENVGDFGIVNEAPIPVPEINSFDPDGSYHEFKEDEWGTVWEFRIFCMQGHPVKWPLENIEEIHEYIHPAQTIPAIGSQKFFELKKSMELHKSKYFYKTGWIGILEKMHALRRFEDVLMDIAMDTPEINKLADMITEYHAEDIRRMIALGVDAVQFGDDYGTQSSLLMRPELWRRFIKPRLARLMKPIKEAGIKVCFHSCGNINELLNDLKEIGTDSIWPQLSVYDNDELARHFRDIGLAVAIHIDRANTMTHGSPDDVRKAVDEAVRIFKPELGGAWFYIEIDNGFPYENIEALMSSIAKYR